MTSEQECYVYIVLPNTTEFVTAGRFRVSQSREGIKLGEFVYGKKYLARSDAVALDPVELPLSDQKYQTTRLNGYFGAIRDAMPDYWGRRVIEHNRKGPVDEFEYLLLGPDDRAGALGFGSNVEPPAPRRDFNKTLILDALQETANTILNGGSLEQVDNQEALQVEKLLLAGTSMGGARPKAVVEDNNELWIAKFSTPDDRWNVPLVEHAMLNLAKACNLNVAESKMTSVAGKDVLLVKRFDRDKEKKDYYRYRMVSALTLLKSNDDSTSRDSWSYLLLADEIRRVSMKPKEDLRELYSRMCFNALVSNLDDHPRNHAILARGVEWQLSPAYDLTPSPTIAQDSRSLAMSCGNMGRVSRCENLISGCARFLLSKEDAENIIDVMARFIKENWYQGMRRAGVTEKDCGMIASAFEYEGFYYSSDKN
jgi:serine/threonine-protein kinase HipA